MDFDFNAEEDKFKSSIACIFKGDLALEIHDMEQAGIDRLEKITRNSLRALGAAGYLDLCIRSDQSPDAMKLLAAREEISRISGPLFISVETTVSLFGCLLKCFGSEGRFSQIIHGLRKGDFIAGVAVSENERHEPEGRFSTIAREDDDNFIISGSKPFVTNAPLADYVAVVAFIDDKPLMAVVSPGDPGIVTGPRLETLGYHGLAVASLELREARVPRANVIGPLEDRRCLEFLLETQDMILALASVGLMQLTLTAAKKYADSHIRDGKPIFSRQEIRFKIAEMLTLTQTSQLLCRRAAWMHSLGMDEARSLVHCAKVFSAEASERVASSAMQILAGQGYIIGNPIERAYRDSKYAALAGTTTELARMSIAEELLKSRQV